MSIAPELNRAFSLGARLNASAAPFEVPGEPTHVVSAPLAHLPTRSRTNFSIGENGTPILTISFEYASEVTEEHVDNRAKKEDGDHTVAMKFGKRSGRIYEMKLGGKELLNDSPAINQEGIEACLRYFVEQAKPTTLQQLMLKAVTGLVVKLIPGWVEHFRNAIAEGDTPPSSTA
jgi:hypothetical protein